MVDRQFWGCMKSGFGHFDSSHRENFCAAALLLAMEVDEGVRT